MSKLCEDKLCEDKLCEDKLCVDKSCADKLCNISATPATQVKIDIAVCGQVV